MRKHITGRGAASGWSKTRATLRGLGLIVGLVGLSAWGLTYGRVGHPAWARLRQFRYAHRGLHDTVTPENSLAAFRRAVAAGYGAELDVHLTRDGRLAVIHDADLARMTGRSATVEDSTSAELASLTLAGTDQTIPLLDDVLPLFESTTALIVEIKPVGGNHAELTAATMSCLDRFNLDYCVESFDPRVLAWLKRHRPEVVRGQLTQDFLRPGEDAGLAWILRFALTHLLGNVIARPDFVAIRFEDRGLGAHTLCCSGWGMQGMYWTIQSQAEQDVAERDDHLIIFEGYVPAGDWPKN
ncbi:MAG: hypothetical protein LBV06_10165 [Propionibacteriaceae bacterium]|nr:hypothetical protein [Propionibacteriaceae bacterium]